MAGSIFAGTDEAPGNVIQIDGEKYKLYRGAASYSVQQEYKGKPPQYDEGNEKLIPYKGSVEKVIRKFKGGLQSSMSYMNARNINEFRNNSEYVLI
jgi:IMP dehydrogenase